MLGVLLLQLDPLPSTLSKGECMNQESKKSDATVIPQPRFKLPFIGHLLSLYLKDPFTSFLNLSSELGPIFRLTLGSRDFIAVSSLEFVKETCDESRFDECIGPVRVGMRKILNNAGFLSVVKTDNPLWRKAHRILLPGFSPQVIQKNYFPIMVEVVKTLFKRWDSTPKEKEINLNADISRTTLDLMGLCAFNYRFNALLSDEIHPLFRSLEGIFEHAGKIAYVPFLAKLQIRKSKECEHYSSTLYKYANDILEEKKKHAGSPGTHKDFIDLMLDDIDKKTGEKLDISNIRDQIIGLIMGGAETSTGLLSCALYNLITHPNVLKKAYAEIDAVLGRDLDIMPSLQNFQELQYINKILNENFRLWPPVFVIEREPLEDTLLGGKYPVKKGQCIWAVTSAVQRDKSIWGKDADSFNPDRFNSELQLDPCAFLPFGVGQRACPGRQFAMFESTIILSMILQRYKLHLRPGYKLEFKVPFTLQPKNTLWVTLEKRNKQL